MVEYIERDALIKAVDKAVLNISGKGTIDALDVYSELRRCICEAPSADVAPVRHGRWNQVRTTRYNGDKPYTQFSHECSNCKWLNKHKKGWHTKYCPNCGAKMDGEEVTKDEQRP